MAEYWENPGSPEEQQELETQLITELNQLAEMNDPSTQQLPLKKHRSWTVRLLALVTVIAFTAVALGIWPKLWDIPSLDFLFKSSQLAREPGIKKLQQAVFMVKTLRGQGTGFNLDPKGLVVTNYHVVKDSEVIYILTPAGQTLNAQLTASWPELDLAVVQVRGVDLPSVQLSAKPLEQGEEVRVIGNPLGFPHVIVPGEVLGEGYVRARQEPVIMIKGDIHPGNSGSPVFNPAGQVAAVIFGSSNHGAADSQEIVGLAIPVSQLQEVLAKSNLFIRKANP